MFVDKTRSNIVWLPYLIMLVNIWKYQLIKQCKTFFSFGRWSYMFDTIWSLGTTWTCLDIKQCLIKFVTIKYEYHLILFCEEKYLKSLKNVLSSRFIIVFFQLIFHNIASHREKTWSWKMRTPAFISHQNAVPRFGNSAAVFAKVQSLTL